MAVAVQMVEVGENLLGAGDVSGRAFNVNSIRFQLDTYVEAVLHDLEIFVAGTEKLLDVRHNFNTFLHPVLQFPPKAAGAHPHNIARTSRTK